MLLVSGATPFSRTLVPLIQISGTKVLENRSVAQDALIISTGLEPTFTFQTDLVFASCKPRFYCIFVLENEAASLIFIVFWS
jgi:hypothetical protein